MIMPGTYVLFLLTGFCVSPPTSTKEGPAGELAAFSLSEAVERGIEVVGEDAEGSLRDPAGEWRLTARGPGFAPGRVELKLEGQPQRIDGALVAEGGERGDERVARGLMVGGSVSLGTGIMLATIGGLSTQPSLEEVTHACPEGCLDKGAGFKQWQALWFFESGALLAGAGATVLVYGTLARRRPIWRAWKAQLGVGIALATLGAVAGAVAFMAPGGLNEVVHDPFPEITRGQLGGALAAEIVGFSLVGSGLALAVLAPVSHKLVGRGKLRAAVSPRLSPVGGSLDLRVAF